jgi:hypothetical protein
MQTLVWHNGLILSAVENISPLTIWGLFPRLLAVVYMIAFTIYAVRN